jgi:DNA-binding FrmR family transcriptional regulator
MNYGVIMKNQHALRRLKTIEGHVCGVIRRRRKKIERSFL